MAPKMKLGGNLGFSIRRVPHGGLNPTVSATVIDSVNKEYKAETFKGVCFFVAGLPEVIFVNAS